MVKIQNNLRALRLAVGLTQLEVAQLLGFKTSERISLWEMGLAYPSIQNLGELTKCFNVMSHEIYPDLFKAPNALK